VHTTAGGRVYYMHFVRLSGLAPESVYSYKVRSGGAAATTSDEFSFRAGPAPGGVTRVNIYGDMGVYSWNNMGNLLEDCHSGAADLIVHMCVGRQESTIVSAGVSILFQSTAGWWCCELVWLCFRAYCLCVLGCCVSARVLCLGFRPLASGERPSSACPLSVGIHPS
jgi:hypothetical protein